jgi:hypothetical protein
MRNQQDAFRDVIRSSDLPDSVAEFATEYERTIGIRDEFLWRWMYSLLPAFRLSCVADTHTSTVREQKTLLTLFITVLDDTAEYERDRPTFEQVRKIPFSDHSVSTDHAEVNRSVLTFASRVWDEIEDCLREAPEYSEYLEFLRYDIRQTINAMDYSRLISEYPTAANVSGAYRYGTHNMVMFPFADVDLMYSPAFDQTELAALREAIWELQRLARIGNWVTTWEREVKEGDYSSGVVIAALREGILDPDELDDPSEQERYQYVDRLEEEDIESRFRDEWETRFADLRDREWNLESVDMTAFVEGMETVYHYHRESRGIK